MAIALGSNALLRGKFNTGSYGAQPTGNWQNLFFRSGTFGASQNMVSDPVLGTGRRVVRPSRGFVDVQNSLVVPLDARAVGFWLKGLLGAPVTTGTGPYTHTFAGGDVTLPDLALEVGHPDLSPAQYFVLLGYIVNQLTINMQTSDAPAAMNVDLLGQAEVAASGTSDAGTPASYTYTPFSAFKGSISREGSPLANITAATFGVNNNATGVRVIQDSAITGGVDLGVPAYSGSLTARFTDTVLLADAQGGGAVELEFAYTNSASESLTFTYAQVDLPQQPRTINGPGGIEASYNWQGSDVSAAGDGLSVVLVNDVASYASV